MRKPVFGAIVAFVLMAGFIIVTIEGCSWGVDDHTENFKNAKRVASFNDRGTWYSIVEAELDGCSYIIATSGEGRPSMLHKANCKNPEHGMSKETR